MILGGHRGGIVAEHAWRANDFPAVRRSVRSRASLASKYANGVTASSPGLARQSLPWEHPAFKKEPQRGSGPQGTVFKVPAPLPPPCGVWWGGGAMEV